jgi:transcription antitermination factor NusG
MGSEVADPGAGIKAGDFVRARSGAYKGVVGKVLRVVMTRDEGRTSESVLVSFPAGGADYLDTDALEKADGLEK